MAETPIRDFLNGVPGTKTLMMSFFKQGGKVYIEPAFAEIFGITCHETTHVPSALFYALVSVQTPVVSLSLISENAMCMLAQRPDTFRVHGHFSQKHMWGNSIEFAYEKLKPTLTATLADDEYVLTLGIK